MKRITAIFLTLMLLFGLAACSNESGQSDAETSSSNESTEKDTGNGDNNLNEETEGSNILVVYFSATGTTKQIAEYATDILNTDLYEIVPEDPYTDEDLDYYSGGRADQEQDDPAARPTISGSVENMEQYDAY